LDDVGLADTAPGSSFHLVQNDEPRVELARADTFLPDLFARVQENHKKHRATWSYLVWTWHGSGDWRSAVPRTPAPDPYPVPDPWDPGDGDWTTGLNAECVQRVRDVREWVRRGDITAADGQRLIRRIVEECT
jgi:hypothetical protein